MNDEAKSTGVPCPFCGGRHPRGSVCPKMKQASEAKIGPATLHASGFKKVDLGPASKLPATGVVLVELVPKPKAKGKRGRPKSGTDRKAYMRDLMRARRAAQKEGK